jgi:hypothetical protein
MNRTREGYGGVRWVVKVKVSIFGGFGGGGEGRTLRTVIVPLAGKVY